MTCTLRKSLMALVAYAGMVGGVCAEEATGQIAFLAVGYPYAPMSLMVVIDDQDTENTYPADCSHDDNLIFSDMSGSRKVDREDAQAFFSLLQTAKAMGSDVTIFYHLDETSNTHTEGHCIIDAVAIL